jgi:putative peptidoglycan lipid II flippase
LSILSKYIIRSMNTKFAKILSATALVAGATLLAKILGLVRDRILASTFGAGDSLDIYYAAFRIPDFIFSLLILGALFAAFIPVYTDYLVKRDEQTAFRLTNSLVNLVLLVSIAAALILFVFAPQFLHLLTPGFDGAKIEKASELMRIMLFSPVIFSISGILVSVLQAHKRFLVFSLAPMFYNAGIIFGATILVKYLGLSGLAWGVVIGALFQLLVQIPAVVRLGYRYRPVIDFSDGGVKKVLKLMLPRAASVGIVQINILVETLIASTLASGSLAILALSNNLQIVPVGVLAVAFATVVFPTLAEKFSMEDKKEFVANFAFSLRQTLFFVIPATAGMFLLRAQIVRLALGAGQFSWTDTILTSKALGVFVISLSAQAMLPLLIRSFFAIHDTKTPFYISVLAVIGNTFFAIFFSQQFGVIGLALAFTATSILHAVLLTLVLHKRLGFLDGRRSLIAVAKFLLATVVMAFVVYGVIYGVEPFVNTHTVLGLSLQSAAAALAGFMTYIGVCSLLSCEEVETIKGKWLKRKDHANNE